MSKLNISEVATSVLASLQGKEGILMAIPGSVPVIVFEDGSELNLDIDLAYFAGAQEEGMIWQGFSFSSPVILSGDIRMTGTEEGEYIIGYVCTPFTKEDGSDVIILRSEGGEVVTIEGEE